MTVVIKDGDCCPVLALALSRAPDSGMGLSIGTRMNFKTGEMSDALVVKFRKGKKGEEHLSTTFGWCLFCPFCGSRTTLGRRAKEHP